MSIVTKYSGISSYYFNNIIDNIIKIGDLKNSKKIILDFGCGEKKLSTKLTNTKILNYDINPHYSDFNSFENLKFDLVIINHVLMYMSNVEIEELFNRFKKINPSCEFIIGIGKQNFLSRIAKNITFNFNAHKFSKSTYEDQIQIIQKKMNVINSIQNIYFMTDIFYLKFVN